LAKKNESDLAGPSGICMPLIACIPLGDRLATNYTKAYKVLRTEVADKLPPHSHVHEPFMPALELACVVMHMLVWLLFLSYLEVQVVRPEPVMDAVLARR